MCRKKIFCISEKPVSYKNAEDSKDGQTWIFVNPTKNELSDSLKETDSMPRSIRILIGENNDIVIANGWFWTHEQMLKYLKHDASYYIHYFAVLGYDKLSVGNYTALHEKDGYKLALDKLREVAYKLISLGIIDLGTTLIEWGDYSGERVGDVIKSKETK